MVEGNTRSNTKLRQVFEKSRPDFPSGTPFWKDSSFSQSLGGHPDILGITGYLPDSLDIKTFFGQIETEELHSSYVDHGYGYLFYGLTRVLKPEICVEIGVLGGFSLLSVASALRDNGLGAIQGFDLFEDYPYRHEKYSDVLGRIDELSLGQWATAERADAFDVHRQFSVVDYLHVDISNNGDTFRQVFEQWAGKVKKVMLLEGGSAARDQVDWMVKYEKTPISPILDELKADYPEWSIHVLEPYPSLTIGLPSTPARTG